ncbi:S1 RNA binding domain family protein [Acanthocheilonema viteae]
MTNVEIDFPREDLSIDRKHRGIYSDNDGTADIKRRKVKNEPKSEYDGVWNQRITTDFLTEGMLGLGVIMKIKETEILLECSDGIIVKVPVQNFGNLMLETLKNSSLTLEDIFKVGQMLAFKVIKAREIHEIRKLGKKASYPIVSCDPLIVNFHLNPGALINGLVLNGFVESVEDKGVIINLGLQSIELKGFLAEKHLPPTFERESLVEGQPLLLRIQDENLLNKKARVISLSMVPETECLNDAAIKRLKLNDLMPGTLLLVNPLQPTASGVYVNIGNDIKGYVSRQHLPPRYRNDPFKCLKSFKTIVMFCQQNSNLLILNGHPDIIAVSKFVKRTNFENIHIGDIIECKVSSVDKNGNVNFDISLHEDEKNPLVAAFARKTELEDRLEYKKGTIHQARVLSFKMVERLLIVATRKDILAQKMVCVKDAVPGEKVTAKVKSVLAKGLFVKIYNSIPGFIPKIHLSDKLITRIDKHFVVGQTVVARVSSVDLERKRFALILDIHLCVPPGAESDYFAPSMVYYVLEELNWFIANNPNISQIPKIGECIDIKIIEVSECSVIVQCADNSNFKGHAINSTNILEGRSCAKALVLDVKLPSCELVLFFLNDGVQHLNEKKLQSLVCSKKKFDAKVWLHKREYAVAIAEVEKLAFVVCIPVRIHPNVNIISAKSDGNDNHYTITPKLVAGNIVIGTAMETLKKYELTHRKFKTPVKAAVKKKLKQFAIYTAKVKGMWSRDDLYNAVELELPDGSIGRLHASEFDESFLNQTSHPVQSFLKKRKNKTVNVKIICFTKLKQKMEKMDLSKPKGKGVQKGEKMVVVTRLSECTMKTWKLNETKRKQSLLGYPQSYTHGSLIPVFVCKGAHVGVVRVEVSPLWNGIIRKQNLYDENLITNPTNDASALVDIDFETGEKLIAQVIGVNVYKNGRGKSRHRKCLEMTLKETRKIFERGDRVTGRVVGITQSPSSVILELTNNQRAVLTLTGITDNYLKAHEAVKSYELNQIYNVQLLRFDNDKGNWLAVMESRYNFSKESKNMLYLSGTDIEIGSKLQAFVTSAFDGAHIFVEISPGIAGCIAKCKKLSLKPDDLVRVRVNHVFPDGGLNVEFVDLIAQGSTEKKPRKRLISVGSGSDTAIDLPRKKSKAAGYVAAHSKENEPPQVTPIEAKLPEPGLDWSLKGFTPAEFASVGQIGEKMDVPVSALISKDESTADNIGEQSKPKTEVELQIEEEKKLINRERKILETDWIPDNTNDFDRLVAGTPNSSILWIRYITFFLERNDVEKARAVAERALSVINFREEDEIFNVWTAYLNLEGNFGTSESLKAVFDNAIKNTDSLKMYKQMVKIYQNLGKIQETDDLLDDILKRFRHDDLDVWFIYGQHLLETKRSDAARNLMKKAINCLARKHHVTILSRFAQLEFKFGDIEQSKTIFENILNSYPKKTDVWTVYIDLLIKAEKIEDARHLLERVTALKLSTHKIRLFFKKWIDLEQRHGDEKQQNDVKQRALNYLQGVTELTTET